MPVSCATAYHIGDHLSKGERSSPLFPEQYEPHIAEGLTQMFVAGTSTHKVGEVAHTLLGVAPSASTISRLNQSLTQQFEAWRKRPLQQHWRVLYLDGVHFSIRHGDKADSTIILTALGVDLEGHKEVLARLTLR
jgi:transposase-like protein